MGGEDQILVWVVWVHKILAWIKKTDVGQNFGVGSVGPIKFLQKSKAISVFFTLFSFSL